MKTPRYLFSLLLLTCVSLTLASIDRPRLVTAQEPQTPQSTSQPSPENPPVINNNTSNPPQTATTPPAKPEAAIIDSRLVLKLKERRVYVFKGGKQVAFYPVAVGKKGWETPTGSFKVMQLVKNPVWQNPWNGTIIPAGPKNPLGERWIGFWSDGKNSIGFHGTTGEHLIGQAVSHGCVRMKNKDIIAMFEKIQMGTPVIVVP